MIDVSKLLESTRLEITFADVNVDRDFVKAFRKEHGLTQIALANMLGVTKKTIEKWEQGKNNVGGSSAVLLKLLNDNPNLIEQLYSVSLAKHRKAANIKWDIDPEDADDIELPDEIDIPADIYDEEAISDYISDVTGFCHKGFELEE